MKPVALAQIPVLETTLTVMNGPQKGTVFRLVSNRVTLGRGSDNDIVIDDVKCSRNHAEVLIGTHNCEIRDLTDRNVITVDGRECKSSVLKDRSTFVLGQTQFKFSLKAAGQLQTFGEKQALSPVTPASAGKNRKAPKKSNAFRYVFVAAIGLILYLGLSDQDENTKTPTTEELAEQEMKAAQAVTSNAETRYRPKDVSPNDLGYRQAQQRFVEGFRDYRKGQFERALASFQACLSLFPKHEMCNRYLNLTRRRVDEIIGIHMVLGRKYRDQNQFDACAASFRNVMVMIKDPNNKRYQEAQANYRACQRHVEERY